MSESDLIKRIHESFKKINEGEATTPYLFSFIYWETFEWEKWVDQIPNLHFPIEWGVKIIPPFGGAIIRFLINEDISVYLDGYNVLGLCEGPYWEIADKDSNTFRFRMKDTQGLLNKIDELINEAKSL